jgi:hypothetical protein
MLCRQCQPIKRLKNLREVVCYYPDAEYLAEEGERGCPTCFVLQDRCWDQLTDRGIPDMLGHNRLRIKWTVQENMLMPLIHSCGCYLEAIMNIVYASGRSLGFNHYTS